MIWPPWIRPAAIVAVALVVAVQIWLWWPAPGPSPATQFTENVAREAVENANTARVEAETEREKANAIEPQIQEQRGRRRAIRRDTANRVANVGNVPDPDLPDRIRDQRERTDAAIRAAHSRRAAEGSSEPR